MIELCRRDVRHEHLFEVAREAEDRQDARVCELVEHFLSLHFARHPQAAHDEASLCEHA